MGSVTVTGYVEKIKFRNEENGYSVLSVNDGKDEYILVGNFPYISEGERIEATGRMKDHPLYGEQLSVESYDIKAPEDSLAMERYLSSGAIKGVGAALAKRIVKKFKADTFRIIEEEPERLAEVKGISERMAMQISGQFEEKREMRDAMLFLQQYGISLNLAVKIYNRYGEKLYSVIRENPYKLADDIEGVGFKTADEIASKAGILADSDFRVKSGLYYALLQATSNGHTYLPEEELFSAAQQLLGINPENMEKYLMDLQIEKKIIVKEKDGAPIVYPVNFYYMELNTARMLHDLNIEETIPREKIKQKLSYILADGKLELDDLQETAVIEAVNHGLLIITGGPGTGKTTTINTIIKYFESENMEVVLAAPTGRAAKRMTEATDHEARTIHRLLEMTGTPLSESETGDRDPDARFDEMRFARDEENPLDADVIIIDEMSMVDINLMHALLKAVSVGTRLILVGDVNQLPSVGPGNVLRDMIESGRFPVVKLTKIFRQAAQSDIILNAHRINAGERVPLDKKSKDFLFIRREQPTDIINDMITLVKDKLPDYVEADPLEIQIMTPMRKGVLGVLNLNKILQENFNPPAPDKEERVSGEDVFRTGDKVMQIKNDYQIPWETRNAFGIPVDRGEGVFNGDIGRIRDIDNFAETVEVEFDEGRIVEYNFGQLDELELAYAVTVHKAQGSEYPAVVIPMYSGPRMLMTRNLIYTAVTRARKCVCLVGSPQVFYSMVDNATEQKRYSGLKDRILELQ